MPTWAERVRIIAEGLSPMPGRFSFDVCPYLEEPAECLSETSPVQEVVLMKGARVCATVGLGENWIGYTIDVAPAPFLYVGADKESAEEVMETRVGPMIELSGLSHRIFAPISKSSSRASGDTKARKDFAGGRLRAIGPNSGAKLRGSGYSRLFLDEIDAWQNEVGTQKGKRKAEGSTMSVILRRSDEYEQSRKILYVSTPLVKSTSLIEPLFLAGDQRRYFVPCKHCGAMQYLKWDGIKFDRAEDGRLIEGSVRYECESCKGHWVNADKVTFMRSVRQGGKAEWRPTAKPTRRGLRSYHLPSFYSPVGFRSWESIVQEWIEAGDDVMKRQTIVNTVFGETWEERGSVPQYEKVMIRREDYKLDEWPERARFVTIGADVQGGQNSRIEAEIVAWGSAKESWSLGYKTFHGDTEDLSSPAWNGLRDLIYSEHAGRRAMCTLVDSSFQSQVVYAFCESMDPSDFVLPAMGESAQNPGRRLFVLHDVTGYAVKRADLQTNQLKAELYSALNRAMPELSPENPVAFVPPGLCHFPIEYGEKFFKMLMAEEMLWEKMPNGGRRQVWKIIKGRGRNEALDCRVYAMGALNVLKEKLLVSLGLEDESVTWDQFWQIIDKIMVAR